jgi:hypothetical protein
MNKKFYVNPNVKDAVVGAYGVQLGQFGLNALPVSVLVCNLEQPE